MERDDRSGDGAYVEARIPETLYERLEALFREYRGYDPSSVQECLSVVADLAERPGRETPRTTGDERRAGADGARNASDAPNAATSAAAADASEAATNRMPADDPPAEIVDAIDAVFPTDWAATETSERLLPRIVRRYVAADDADTRAERENAALSAVAAREGTAPEELRGTLVDDIYGRSALPGDLATEFFSEALEKVERRVGDAERETLSPSDLVDVGPDAGAQVGPDAEAPADPDAEARVDPEARAPVDADAGAKSGADADLDAPLDDAEADATETENPAVGLDLGPGSGDLPRELADEMASDGGAVQSVDERVDNLFTEPNGLTEIGLDSMVAGARADCEICGASRSIRSLETTTEASDDRRVDLVCPDCL